MRKLVMVATTLAVMAATATSAHAAALVGPSGALPVGANVTLTSSNFTWVSAFGTHKCNLVTATQQVTQNGPRYAALSPVSASVAGCSAPFQSISLGTVQMDLPYGDGLAHPMSMTWANYVCQSSGGLPFAFTTGSNVLTIYGSNQVTGTCGGHNLSGSFQMKDANGAAVTVQ